MYNNNKKAHSSWLVAHSCQLPAVVAMVFFLSSFAGISSAADIKVVPSAAKVTPGETFYADVVVEGIPAEGLGAVQFRLNVSAPGSTVAAVTDTIEGLPGNVSVSSPLIVGPPTSTRSGISDFFWNAKSEHGVLVIDNEALNNGMGLYTLGHTNGALLPSGGGSVARFQINAGSETAAEKIILSLSDVALLDGSTVYAVDSNTGATVDLKCYTQAPDLIGLSKAEAETALAGAKLIPGNIYELDNTGGTYALDTVLVQSANPGSTVLCETTVDLAINTAPAEITNLYAADKSGDESGIAMLSWLPSSSDDAAGYRIYNASGARLAEIADAASTGTELSGLIIGAATQLRITSYDIYGNESAGVGVIASALDDMAPRIDVTGVADGAYYASDIKPVITVQEANLAAQEITLNGLAYNQSLITLEDDYLLKILVTDTSGNSATKEIRFAVDKTAPVITVSGIEKNGYYNYDLSPVISVTERNPETTESSLNGSPYTSGTLIEAENNYQMVVFAVDKAGNSATETYPFLIDKTRPVSTIAAGTPQFENSGMLYVAGATSFAIEGTDAGIAPSGIDKLEYRANSEIWNLYQVPVTLSGLNDGPVTMNYRAVDRATNVEDFHALSVVLDTTAPSTTLTPAESQYTDPAGVSYVAQNSVFTLSASDALSGVNKTEFRIDETGWSDYTTAITVSAYPEGAHTIRYRSIDNLGNTEDARETAVIVDSTPPVTSISASDQLIDGVINTVSPVTFFTLSAADDLSGIRTVAFRIDDGVWQSYTGSFSLADMAAGQHTITYKATDNVLNEEAEKTIAVRLIVIEVEKKIAADSIVLVGVESDKTDLERKQADIQKLDAVLSSINLNYTIAADMDEFTTALRSGIYNTYILIDVKEPLVGKEIREAIHSGDGLIFIKTRPNEDPFLDDVFGLKFSGKTTSDNPAVDLLSSAISGEGTLRTTGKSVVSQIAGENVQIFGSVADKHNVYPAIVYNEYQRGKALTYTFDLLSAEDQALASALMIESLNLVRPEAETPTALGSVPVRITVSNSSEPVEVKVTESFPYGTTADSIVPAVTPVDNTLIWQKSMAAGEQAGFGYRINLPDTADDYVTETELAYNNNGFFRPYGRYQLALTFENNREELLRKIIDDLHSLQVETASDADSVGKCVEQLLLLDDDAAARKEAEDNIRNILEAIDEARNISTDVTAIRLDLDELLKVWEKTWYQMEPETE